MTTPSPKLLAAAGAAIAAHLALLAAPAQAGSAAYYRVQFAQPVAETTLVADGLAWKCAGNECVAAKSNSRPEKVCARLSRKHGKIAQFSSAHGPLDAGQLARCNRD